MLKKKIVENNPMDAMDPPKFEKRIIEPFKASQIRQLLAQCDITDSRFEQARNRAIILTFLDTGLRLAELANIKLDDMDEESEIIKVLGKGAKERLISITPGIMEAICYYLIIRKKTFPNNPDRHLWINKLGKPFKTGGIQEMISDLGKRAGIEGVRCSPHTFRHTFGTMFMDNAAEVGDPENAAGELQTLLGHETQAMTRHYTENAKRRVALKAHKKYSPLKNLILDA
jgi:integrase/recombinase XerC/integrase/recombinase XerD